MGTGLAGILVVYLASDLAKANPPSVTPLMANRVVTPPPPTPLPPTPYPTEQPQVNLIVVPPTPIPVLGPEWQPGPPRPTWYIPYGNIRFKEEMRFYSEQKDCEGCRSNRVYGTQFPAQTQIISFACSYERDSQDILQSPIVMVWKLNGTEYAKDQVNWRFEHKSAEIGRALVGGNFPPGRYQVDCYWNRNWIATGTYEVY